MSLSITEIANTEEKRNLLLEAIEAKLRYHENLIAKAKQGAYDKQTRCNAKGKTALDINKDKLFYLSEMYETIREELTF